MTMVFELWRLDEIAVVFVLVTGRLIVVSVFELW